MCYSISLIINAEVYVWCETIQYIYKETLWLKIVVKLRKPLMQKYV